MQAQSSKGLLAKFTDRVRSAVIDRAYSYYQGGKFTPLGAQKLPSKGTIVVIASASEYTLSKKQYPIKAISELKTLLNSNKATSGIVQWKIGGWKNNVREVTRIEYKRLTHDELSSIKVLLPEFLLLQHIERNALYELHTPAHTIYASKINDEVQTALQGGVIHTQQLAKTALDLPAHCNTRSLAWSEYRQYLYDKCVSSSLRYGLKFRVKKEATQRLSVPVIPLSIVAIALVFCYLALSSVYISQTQSVRQAQLDSYGAELNLKLQARAEEQALRDKLNALEQARVSNVQTVQAMELYAWLKAESVTPSRFAASGDSVELTAEVPVGTILVTRLNELAIIDNVEFNAPVRRARNGEIVNLRIVLRGSDANPVKEVIAHGQG